MVGAVEPADDGGADRPHAEVDFLGEFAVFATPFHAGTRSPAHPRAQAISRESAGARSLVPRLWAHEALDAVGDHIHVCLT